MIVRQIRPPSDHEGWLWNDFRHRPCYYCADTLTSPFVLWMGVGEPIGLHPSCAVELTIRLLRDVHEIECETHADITAPKPPPASLAALKDRLARREGAP